jgi:N-acyl-D-amino-acid deacylase
MTRQRSKPTRRAALRALAGLGGLTAAGQVNDVEAQAPRDAYQAKLPVQGKAGPGLEPFDAAMKTIMDRHGIPGAALAITKNGKLLCARSYGWSNVARGTAVEPDTMFGLASLSKPLTAVATLKLVEQGKLKLDDPVFDILTRIKPPTGARVDPRLGDITVRQCLNHSGGWDRDATGDVINWEPQICRAYRVRPPLSPGQLISFVMGVPLNFKPGTNAKYSNTGYIVLGEVIAAVSGQPYEQFVTEKVLKPMGMTRTRMIGFDGKYMAGEAIRYLPGTLLALPAMLLPMVNATGGWSSSAVDLARFMTNIEGSRGESVLAEKTRKLMLEQPPAPLRPRPDGTWFGLGWDAVLVNDRGTTYYKEGSYQGMRTFMKHLPNGVSWALVYNASMEFDPQDMRVAASTVREARQLVESFEKYPDIDLFKEFP